MTCSGDRLVSRQIASVPNNNDGVSASTDIWSWYQSHRSDGKRLADCVCNTTSQHTTHTVQTDAHTHLLYDGSPYALDDPEFTAVTFLLYQLWPEIVLHDDFCVCMVSSTEYMICLFACVTLCFLRRWRQDASCKLSAELRNQELLIRLVTLLMKHCVSSSDYVSNLISAWQGSAPLLADRLYQFTAALRTEMQQAARRSSDKTQPMVTVWWLRAAVTKSKSPKASW